MAPHLIGRTNRSTGSPTSVQSGVRPDDRPAWVETSIATPIQQRWRAAAARARLPVDAWVALLLEHSLVAEDLADETSRVLKCAKQLLQTPYIPAGASRRRWLRQLTDGTVAVAERDELPSLVLPSRLLARVAPNDLAVRLSSLENGDIESAKILELAALAAGLTMEAWAYRCALRLVAR